MNNKKSKPLGGGVYQLNNNQLFNLQLFADTINYDKVDNPYEHILTKNTYAKGDIYNLVDYYKKITNYINITSLPKKNVEYIKEALPNVTSCSSMMGSYDYTTGCESLTFIDTTGWDTSKIETMNSMFACCNALTTLDVSKFNTIKVTDMNAMFYRCYKLTTLDVSNWDTSNVTDMNCMFQSCLSLTTLDLSNLDTSNVTNMRLTFDNCGKLTTLDISNWDTSKVTDMRYMFSSCSALTTIKGVIDMKSCTSYDGMFESCNNLSGVKIKNPPSGITATSGIGGLKAGKYTIVS